MLLRHGPVMEVLPDTPALARPYCPACEPDADPCREILDVRWCDSHMPARDGLDDEVVPAGVFPSGSAEAGGDDNRRWCEIVHGRVDR
jgi:hypothetical protein